MQGTWWMRRWAASLALLALASVLCAAPAAPEGAIRDPDADPGDVTGQVVGGTPVEINAAPWQVSLWVDDDRDGLFFGVACGGSLISRRVVVTAAHCLDAMGRTLHPSQIRVVAGTVNPFPSSEPLRQVAKVSRHPRSGHSGTDDLGYLLLADPVPDRPAYRPIATAGPADVGLYLHGTPARVSGWGSTVGDLGSPSFPTYPRNLRAADVPVVGDVECAAAYAAYGLVNPAYAGVVIDAETMVCAGSAVADACYGDSGGPLWIDRDGLPPLLVGITSFGPAGCALAAAPGVFTEVAAYADMTAAHLGPAPFTDIGFGHPFLTEVSSLKADGIVGGFPNGTYRGNVAVSRQAMSAFLYRLAGEPTFDDPDESRFRDVTPGHPFFTEVEWMASTGITTGNDDGTFAPAAPVSRMAMSAFLYRFQGEPPFDPGAPTFADVRTSHPFFTEVQWMASTGITTGYAGNTFRPATPVSRQAMAAFLYRLLRLDP